MFGMMRKRTHHRLMAEVTVRHAIRIRNLVRTQDAARQPLRREIERLNNMIIELGERE